MRADLLLFIGSPESRLPVILTKLGYQVIKGAEGVSIPDVVSSKVVDLIVIDSRAEEDALSLCEFCRTLELTKQVPIIFLPKNEEEIQRVKEIGGNIEALEPSSSAGLIATRVATVLRLRKIAGEDSQKATIAEMNAALRDLNERFRIEREQAKSIQLSLLPGTLPSSPLYDVAVHYQPLDEVGGDWYFIDSSGDNKLSLLVADVTGHGLSAAFVGSMTKLALSAAGEQEPDRLLKEVNRLMAPHLPEGRFITMISVGYDASSGAVTCARAGHPPALVLSRSAKKVTELKGAGFAVGFFEDGNYALTEAKLEPNDVMVLITDGISEAQNRSSETYGLAPLSKILLNSDTRHSASDILKSIMTDFRTFSQERLIKDDITLVVLKRK